MMQNRPNILFFFPDQVRACELGYAGGRNVETPNVNRLASEGVVFTNAISTCPLCTPYRAMLQTGRWPTHTGGVMNNINLYGNGERLAEVFGRAGYDTGYIGKWHLAPGFEGEHGRRPSDTLPVPNSSFVPPGPARMGWQFWAANNFSTDYIQKPFYFRDTPEKLYWGKFETDGETDLAIQYVRERARAAKPFFLMVSPHPPHAPWRYDQVPRDALSRIPRDLYWPPNVKGRRDTEGRFDYHCYFAMLRNADENFGRLLGCLDETGLAENTIVVFSTDHGEMRYSQGLIDKMYPYAEAVNIPLIMRWPKRIRPRTVSDALYTPMDHFPTLAALCGVTVPSSLNGMSLAHEALGSKGPRAEAALMMNYVSSWNFPETMTSRPEWRAVRTAQHTYVHWINGPEEFYDNLADPCQMQNLFNGRRPPAEMDRLRARLKDLLAAAGDEFPPGTAYASWFDRNRNVVRTALGPANPAPAR